MKENSEQLIDAILQSYEIHDMTVRVEADDLVNKEILIQVMEEIRRILFPGFFDGNRVRGEYLKYLVGERVEFIQYNLRKQVAKVAGPSKGCGQCPKSAASKEADQIVYTFLDRIPKIREYLYTDIQAAYARCKEQGYRVLGEITPGAGGCDTFFIHPKDTHGVLTEFVSCAGGAREP